MFTAPNPFTIIANRARRLLDSVEEKIRRGEISTRAGLLTELISRVAAFTRSLREPAMEVPRMGRDELLIREYVDRPIDTATEDLELAYEQNLLLRDLVRQLFNLTQAELAGLQELLAENSANVDRYRLWITDSDPTFVWAGDTFNDKSKVDPTSTVFVDTAGGVVTLLPASSKSLSERVASLTIDREISAGGLPGNNLEIRAPGREAFTGERKEPRPVLYSDAQPRKDNLAAILDGQPDTWFEFERVYVPVPQPTIKAGKAFVADPAGKPNRRIPRLSGWNTYVRWPGEFRVDTGVARKGYPLAYFKPEDRRDLRLAIQFALDEPTQISWMRLTPFLRENNYPIVEQVLVSFDGDQWRGLLSEPVTLHPRMNRGIDFSLLGLSASNFEGIFVLPFPGTPLQYVKVILRQPGVYQTSLGIAHKFFLGPKGKKRVKGPVSVVGSFQSRLQGDEQLDFADDETTSAGKLLEAYDIFTGQRQAIAIRDCVLEQRSYPKVGQLVSRPFPMPEGRPARAVALVTTEQIPEDWPETTEDGRPWLFYEVSTDGQTWSPIVPQRAQLDDSVVHFDTPAQNLYLRVTLSRPEDRPTESPVLQAYALKVLP